MKKDTAKKLDDILSTISKSGGKDYDFVFDSSEEACEFDDYLAILEKDKYIIDWGEDEKSRIVFISPKGRMFVKNGGYTGIIEEKERAEKLRQEELRAQQDMLSRMSEPQRVEHVYIDKTNQKSGIWKYLAAIVGFLGTIDTLFNGSQTLLFLLHRLSSLLQNLWP